MAAGREETERRAVVRTVRIRYVWRQGARNTSTTFVSPTVSFSSFGYNSFSKFVASARFPIPLGPRRITVETLAARVSRLNAAVLGPCTEWWGNDNWSRTVDVPRRVYGFFLTLLTNVHFFS